MKIKLLNDGGINWGMAGMKFPTDDVSAEKCNNIGFKVSGSELIRIGADSEIIDCDYNYFFTLEECEIVDEQRRIPQGIQRQRP